MRQAGATHARGEVVSEDADAPYPEEMFRLITNRDGKKWEPPNAGWWRMRRGTTLFWLSGHRTSGSLNGVCGPRARTCRS